MKLIRTIVWVITVCSISATCAIADGMPRGEYAAPFNWSGFYAGLNAGGAWGESSAATNTVFSPTGYFATTSVPAIGAVGARTVDGSGFVGGGQLGYNVQSGTFLWGIETDFNFLGLRGGSSGSATYPCCAPTAFTLNSSAKADWLFTLRPRIGLVSGNWLFYGTGGLALTNIKGNFLFTDTFATAHESASFDTTKAGWTIGGGGEVMLHDRWTVKLEYLFVDFGSVSTTSTNLTAFSPPIAFSTNVFTHSADLQAHIVRAGINYKF